MQVNKRVAVSAMSDMASDTIAVGSMNILFGTSGPSARYTFQRF